jgi:hypothetical protein
MVALLKMPLPAAGASDTVQQYPKLAQAGAERRVFPRRDIATEVLAKRLDHSLAALRQPSLRLALRDVSLSGLSAISDTPLERGERLTVSFPALSLAGGLRRAGGWDAVGRVVRCETSGLGYRVAVEFEDMPSAA